MIVKFSFPRQALEAFLDSAIEAENSDVYLYGAGVLWQHFGDRDSLANGWQTSGGHTYTADLGAETLTFEGSRTSLRSGCVPGAVFYSCEDCGSRVSLCVGGRCWPGEVLYFQSSLPELPWYASDSEIEEILKARDIEDLGEAIEEHLSHA